MRFIGGKSLMLDNINTVIQENIGTVDSVLDIFSGSGIVSENFKKQGMCVISNDFLYFCYVLTRGTISINRKPSFKKLGIDDPIAYLNGLTREEAGIALEDCFIYQNYSPNEHCDRMYFQNQNAIRIDVIRQTIEKWRKEKLITAGGYYYLLAALINAVPYVANITGVYVAYLKFWEPRTYNELKLEEPVIFTNRKRNQCLCTDYSKLLEKKCDLMYADPPYNGREYLPNYHVLETIARYDNPEIYGVTGLRNYDDQKSEFCKKGTVYGAFERLVRDCESKYILISYNNEALLPQEQLQEICGRYCVDGNFKVYEYDYRRYKNKIPNNTAGLKEQLYFLQRH